MSGPVQQPMSLIGANQSAAAGGEPIRENAITRLVDAVVAHLRDALPGAVDQVEEYPDKPGSYDLGTRRAVVLVHYRGSKYRPPASNGAAVQTRAMLVDVHILTRGLGGTSVAAGDLPIGAYDLVEAVRFALQGHTLEGCGPIIATDDGASGEKDGVWSYVVQFAAATRAVAALPFRRPDVGGYPETDR